MFAYAGSIGQWHSLQRLERRNLPEVMTGSAILGERKLALGIAYKQGGNLCMAHEHAYFF